MEKLISLGEKLGLQGEQLQAYVTEQQAILRTERTEAREKEKREHEMKMAELEARKEKEKSELEARKEKEKREHEEKMAEIEVQKKREDAEKEEMESPHQYLVRLESYLKKWMDLTEVQKTFEGIMQLILTEQFIAACNEELATFLKERTCKDLKELANTADHYLQAHGKQLRECSRKKSASKKSQGQQQKIYCAYCKNTSHSTFDCKQKKGSEPGKPIVCYYCSQTGHPYTRCPQFLEDRRQGTLKTTRTGAVDEYQEVGAIRCYFCNEVGHVSSICPKKNQNQQNSSSNTVQKSTNTGAVSVFETIEEYDSTVDCNCMNDQANTISLACGKRLKIISGGCDQVTLANEMPKCRGSVNGHDVEVLRDTGCSGVVVKKKFVADHQYTGQYSLAVMANKTCMKAEVAMIEVDCPYYKGTVQALCFEDALYDLMIGNVEGARPADDPYPVAPSIQCDIPAKIDVKAEVEVEIEKAAVTETRAQAKKSKFLNPLKIPGTEDQMVTKELLVQWQKEDDTINKFREMTDIKKRGSGESWYEVKDDILYRKFKSPLVNNGEIVTQVMVPQLLRKQVMCLAHDSIMGGHMGVRRSYDKIIQNFFWPGIHGDVTRYCRSCDVCQRTTYTKARFQKHL